MYIQRSVLLLFVFIYLIYLVGMDWINAMDASWYRPFLVALAVIGLSAWLQGRQESDDH